MSQGNHASVSEMSHRWDRSKAAFSHSLRLQRAQPDADPQRLHARLRRLLQRSCSLKAYAPLHILVACKRAVLAP